MFCEWDKDLQIKVVRQPHGSNLYGLSKKTPYTMQRIYNGKIVGYTGCFSSRVEADHYLMYYAKVGS